MTDEFEMTVQEAKAFTYHFEESRKLTSLEARALHSMRRICDAAIALQRQYEHCVKYHNKEVESE